ncbi:MAG: 3'-5' exonuclease [Oscillospiraceae bacterium]|nr:3'-5' exonuclease [Oscillospiraceae bacterium]
MQNEFLSLRKQYIESCFGRLNPVQRDAAFTGKGPLLILAGAGSGKTTVLVNRIANLVLFGEAYYSDKIYGTVTEETLTELKNLISAKEGTPSETLQKMLRVNTVRPYNILAITFTNKAAGELKNRLETMLGMAGQEINAATFHSACVRILRREAEYLGYPKSFTIYDTDDTQRAMKEIYKQLSIDDKFLPIKTALSSIGRLKDKMIGPREAAADSADYHTQLVAKIYAAYSTRLRNAGAMDFDDLIYNTVKLLQDNQAAREYYQNRYQYILVDEYQDTSIAQFKLVELLGAAHRNVCVVGDDDQSIYRFRGATIENILNFESYFTGAKVIRLEQNYRSTSNILNAANCVIKNNMGRKGKTLWTQNGEGDKVNHYIATDEYDEASHIAGIIGENLKKGAHLRDHAVLYRMNAQSNPVETYFARAGIPYKIVGGQRFYDRKEIKDIIAYMSIVANNKDDLRLKRIINSPSRKIGATTLDKVQQEANNAGKSMLEVISDAGAYPSIVRAAAALHGFYNIYEKLCQAAETLSMDAFVTELIEITGYRQMLQSAGEEGQTRLENIGQLISSVKTYADDKGEEATLQGFLEEVALISDIDSYDAGADVVILMTMHAAKGLEFDYVFIVGLEDGIFPSEMARYNEEDLEEERRLCYVGITRAKKELYLSSAAQRMLFGQTKRNRPSRFLDEIDAEILHVEKHRSLAYADEQRERREHTYGQKNAPVFTSHSTISAGYVSNTASAADTAKGSPSAGSFAAFQAARNAQKGVPATGAAVKSAPKASFEKGDLVEHKVFGKGTVLNVKPVAGDMLVEVQFTAGIKKMMANYAPLSKV